MPKQSELDAESCFRTYGPRVYRWAYGLCRRHADAADVTQEVFTRMVRRPPPLDGEAAAIAWLRRVTDHVVIDRWRAGAAHRTQPLPPDASAADPRGIDEDTSRSIREALRGLSAQQRLVVVAKVYDDLSFREIAEELDISIPTAKTHYLRAVMGLRDRLRQLKPTETRT